MPLTDPASATNTADPRPAMSGAEERYEMLRHLASLGMRLAEEVCERAINSPYHPEQVHEPARAFAAVSRAVRLTIVLQAKFEAEWFAFRDSGALPMSIQCGSRPRVGGKPVLSDATSVDDRDDAALETLNRARESLHEYERFDETLSRPFDDCIAAIRADLGLAPEDEVASCGMDDASPSDGATIIRDTSAPTSQAPKVGALDFPDTG